MKDIVFEINSPEYITRHRDDDRVNVGRIGPGGNLQIDYWNTKKKWYISAYHAYDNWSAYVEIPGSPSIDEFIEKYKVGDTVESTVIRN